MLDGQGAGRPGQPPPPPISPWDLHIALAERYHWPDFITDALDPAFVAALEPFLRAHADHERLVAERLKRRQRRG